MTTRLADIYNPLVFDGAMQEGAIELNRFLQAGVLAIDERINNMASGPGQVGDLPFFFGLTNDEPNYSTDDPAVKSTPDKVSGEKQVYMSAHQNKSWSTMDLARELGLQDPMQAITDRVGKYWAVNTEKRLINSGNGVLADSVANHSSDMVHDIFTEDGDNATADNKISANAVLDARQTMGDHGQNLAVIAMHSMQYNELNKQNLIQFIPNSEGVIDFPRYLGLRVIEDDSLPVRAGTTSGFVYTVMLCALMAYAYGDGAPPVPSELEREPDAGNGGGQDILYTRRTEIIHPWGYAFNHAAIAGQSATYAELAAATNWTRVYAQRKNIGLAFLRCN